MRQPTATPFVTYKQAMIDRYGAPLYRVPVDLGLSCPHRRPDGGGGCAFCPPHGSRAVQTRSAGSIEDQIHGGVAFAESRYGARKFMAYLQAFTATFAPVDEQRALFGRVLSAFPFDALCIGTRPDCLPEETLELLEAVKNPPAPTTASSAAIPSLEGSAKRGVGSSLDIWVELGVQTVHDETLRRINRGHDWETSRRAILALHARGLQPAAHVILGLPGETRDHMLRTADALATLPLAGIKIHNLHVIRGAPLEHEYRERPFPVLDEQEYAGLLIDFLGRLPPTLPIMRLNTDTPPDELIAPRWRMKKAQFLSYLIDRMRKEKRRQGDRVQSCCQPECSI
jgi:radical SAM superfamily enzyme